MRAGHQTAEFPDERPHLFFALVSLALAPVGDGFTLVGLALALVGLALAPVGLALAPVSEGFADDGVLLAPVGVASRLRPRRGLFRSSRLRGLYPAGISLPGVIRTWVHEVTLPGTLAHHMRLRLGPPGGARRGQLLVLSVVLAGANSLVSGFRVRGGDSRRVAT